MNFSRLIRVSRPRFWLYLLGSYLIGYVGASDTLALQNSAIFVSHLFLFSLPVNLFLYGVNDIYDSETDKLNPKKSDKEIRLNISDRSYLFTLLPGLFGVLMIATFAQPNNLSRLLMGMFVFLAFFYSAPPLRFKAIPGLDFVSNVLYVVPGFLAFAQLAGELPPLWVVVSASLFAWGLHLFSAIPDIRVDRYAGINTSAVVLGYHKSLGLVAFLWGAMALLVIVNSGMMAWSMLALVYPMFALYLLIDSQARIVPIYWTLPYVNGFLGFCLYWYIVIAGDKWLW